MRNNGHVVSIPSSFLCVYFVFSFSFVAFYPFCFTHLWVKWFPLLFCNRSSSRSHSSLPDPDPGLCLERWCIQWSALSTRNTWTPKKRRTTIKCAELLFEYFVSSIRILHPVFAFEYLFVSSLPLSPICMRNPLTIALKYDHKYCRATTKYEVSFYWLNSDH